LRYSENREGFKKNENKGELEEEEAMDAGYIDFQ
jgi:hypothetical protein